MAIFTILYGNYYPPHGEFTLICIGKFARRTWVNFTQQYGKNRQRFQRDKVYYAVWQLLPYYYREFHSKILSEYDIIANVTKTYTHTNSLALSAISLLFLNYCCRFLSCNLFVGLGKCIEKVHTKETVYLQRRKLELSSVYMQKAPLLPNTT